ncbi:aldo/keto reductase [Agrobacterium tumefaciens]|uniref:aldo/keto reductase n=1 Tax=Agrobacterium tumefaciens TaxID=358 RepID=UPI00224415F5|nr:aldo/keto reductase [Agrobacterium tumefaciens]MCW8060099.1 aldo/keto reductase [Agrobacterium tumefaciens]
MKHLRLRNGRMMPALGLGTYQLVGNDCYRTVRRALEIGYRHVDTAEAYHNEAEIGRALADAAIIRDEIFLTTKIWPTHFRKNFMRLAVEHSLRKLGSDYVDLLLLHWPSKTIPLEETVEALSNVVEQGKAKAVGVSNFADPDMLILASNLGPAFCSCQLEYHALLKQTEALRILDLNDIAAVAYSPIARGLIGDIQVLKSIGDKRNKTAAQVALRWLLQQKGVGAVPKASNSLRLVENFDIFDFELSPSEMDEIFAVPSGVRVVGDKSFPAKEV